MTYKRHDLTKNVCLPSDLHRRLGVIKAQLGLRSLAEAVAALELAVAGKGPLAPQMHAFATAPTGTPSDLLQSGEGQP